MADKIYTLKSAAKEIFSTVGGVRMKIAELKKKELPLEWRGFKFIKLPRLGYIAIRADENIEVID